MPDAPAQPTAVSTLGAAGSSVSLTSMSPPEQGDALSGLTLVVAGVGPAAAPPLAGGAWPDQVGAADAWSVAVESETGWYVLLSQDCDIVRDAADEPTVQVAPLMLVEAGEWANLERNGYSARRWAYPSEKFTGVPEGMGLVVDLAWVTSVVKGSLATSAVHAVRPLTGPARLRFSEWLAQRTGRVPFPDDVVEKVLDPCHAVRTRLSKAFDKAGSPGSASVPARAVAAVERWFAHRDGALVTFLGQLTNSRLANAGFFDPATGQVDATMLLAAQTKLQAEIVKKVASVDPQSGYQVKVVLADLSQVKASDFVKFALLVR